MVERRPVACQHILDAIGTWQDYAIASYVCIRCELTYERIDVPLTTYLLGLFERSTTPTVANASPKYRTLQALSVQVYI